MASMGPQDVRDRLSDRFRLLAGSRRGLERHQTLRHAVGWSYDLLDDDERAVLNRCSVFSGGFDLAAAAHLCRDAGFDEYRVVDLVDSLVRKSLVTTEQAVAAPATACSRPSGSSPRSSWPPRPAIDARP